MTFEEFKELREAYLLVSMGDLSDEDLKALFSFSEALRKTDTPISSDTPPAPP